MYAISYVKRGAFMKLHMRTDQNSTLDKEHKNNTKTA